MKNKIKLFIFILFASMLSIGLTGCWNSREVNSLAFVVSMGFDKTDDGMLITIQVLNPRAIASQKTVDEPTVVVYTETGKDTMEMIRRLITKSSRKLNLTHMQTVIFGEEFAKEGISNVLDFFLREHQVRSDIYFTVAKGITASSVMHTLTTLDSIPAVKLLSSIKASDEIWAGTKAEKVISLVNSIISDGTNPVITGVQLTDQSPSAQGQTGAQGQSTQSQSTQGQSAQSQSTQSQSYENDTIERLREIEADPLKIMGLSVFRKDKLIGWLNEDECKGYNYIIGHVKSTVGYIEEKDTGKMTFEATGSHSKIKATLENEKPVITVTIDMKLHIENSSDQFDVSKKENIKKLEKLSEEKILGYVKQSLNKTQKDLKCDVFGFGEVIHRAYPKLWNTLKENWDDEFADLPVKINVTATIDATGTISKSIFIKDKG